MSGTLRCAIIVALTCLCLLVVASFVMAIVALVDISALAAGMTTVATAFTTTTTALATPTASPMRVVSVPGHAEIAPLQRHIASSIRQSILKSAALAVQSLDEKRDVVEHQKRDARPVLLANNAIDTKKTGAIVDDRLAQPPPLVDDHHHSHKHKVQIKGAPVKPTIAPNEPKTTLSLKDKLRKGKKQ